MAPLLYKEGLGEVLSRTKNPPCKGDAKHILEGGWLAFDGGRALVVGDYVTPDSGKFAGQLGPWSKVVSAVGIEPRSTLMKSIHLVLGLVWMVMMACFALGYPWAWWGMLGCAIAGLWYLPFGTLLSVVQIALLLLPPLRTQVSISS